MLITLLLISMWVTFQKGEILMKILKRLLSLLFIIISIILVTITPNAREIATLYSVQAILPTNQINSRVSYFDLRLEQGQSQIIEVLITNTSDEPIKLQVSVNNAATNFNGHIMYMIENVRDDSLLFPMESIATVIDKQFVLDVDESRLVKIELVMPDQTIPGVVLGGIIVRGDRVNQESKPNQDVGINLDNRVAHVIGLVISENDDYVTPNMNYLGTHPTLHGLATAVGVTLQNTEAVIMQDVSINAEVYQKNSDNLLFSASTNHANIAPNSSFDFIVDWEGNALVPGTYRLKLSVEYEEYVWQWDEEFTIGQSDASNLNNNAISARTAIPYLLFSILAALATIILAFIILILFKKRKDKKKIAL